MPPIPRHIPPRFAAQNSAPRHRNHRPVFATVTSAKAPMHENSRPKFRQHNVRLSREVLPMQPKSEPIACSTRRTRTSGFVFRDRIAAMLRPPLLPRMNVRHDRTATASASTATRDRDTRPAPSRNPTTQGRIARANVATTGTATLFPKLLISLRIRNRNPKAVRKSHQPSALPRSQRRGFAPAPRLTKISDPSL